MKTIPNIDQEVVRSIGDYVVGRIGRVITFNAETRRAQVQWEGYNKTWVSFDAIEPTDIPYEIIRPDGSIPRFERKRGSKFPQYVRK